MTADFMRIIKVLKDRVLIICALALLFAFSCSKDLKFTLPAIDPLLAIQSLNDPDNTFQLIVTMAKPIQDQNIQMNPDCQVDIYENDLFFKSLKLDTALFKQSSIQKNYLRFASDVEMSFSEGNEYKVEVNYPGFEKVTASAVKPDIVKIKQLTWRQFTGEMPSWYYETPWKRFPDKLTGEIIRDTNLIEVTIMFDDPSEITNYYRVGINLITNPSPSKIFDRRLQYATNMLPDPCYMIFNYKTKNPLYSGWTNPLTYEILWNDNNFNGGEHSLKILIPGGPDIPIGTKYIISLYSLSEDYYKYMVDRWKYSKTENDPFAEPIKLFSNTSNGCGIFAFSSLHVDTVIISKSN